MKRLVQCVSDACGNAGGVVRGVDTVQDGTEFVTADTGQGILFAQADEHPSGSLLQQEIPHFVAVAVIHLLETVQVEIKDRQSAFAAFRLAQGLLQPVIEYIPVG